MHTMWKGSISFGLVNIPVKMFAATEDKDIRFKYIHKECNTPIKYQKTCPVCNREIKPDEIVRGYEYEPGKYVIMQDSDFEAIKPDADKSIEIADFVLLKDIDPIYFDSTYYLSPQDTGSKAYNLLREALGKSGKIAVAKVALRERQSLAVIRVYENLLVMETIFYPDEVRETSLVPNISEKTNVIEAELNMALQLIDNLTVKFDPEKYKDEYREKLVDVINKKVEGKEIVAQPDVQKNNIIDLMQALQESLKQTGSKPSGSKALGSGKAVKGTVARSSINKDTGTASADNNVEESAAKEQVSGESNIAKPKRKARQKLTS